MTNYSLLMVMLLAAAAVGWPSDQELQAGQWLKDHPGGTLTGPSEITYVNPGDIPSVLMIVTLQAASPPQSDCPATTLCLYAGPDFGYPRAITQACGFIDLRETGWQRSVRAINNNLPGGDHNAGVVGLYHDTGDLNTNYKISTVAHGDTIAAPPGIDYLFHTC